MTLAPKPMNPPVIFHLLALLPLLAFGYVTWRLIHHRERVAAAIAALVVIALTVLHPLVQIAADSLIARPYAEKKKSLADGADIVGKDFAFVVSRLGEPKRIRVASPTIVTTATRAITTKREPYTALYYFPSSAIYMSTRFIVFLDSAGIV